MGTRSSAFILLSLLCPPHLTGQGSFMQLFGEHSGQDGVGVLPAGDGYVVAARVYDDAGRRHRPALMHCSAGGTLLSETMLPVDGRVFLQAMAAGIGGAHFLAGSSFAPGRTTHDGLLVKTDASGNVLWTQRPDLPGDQQYIGVAPMPDGGAVACGTSAMDGALHPLIVRFASNGDLLWSQVIASEQKGMARAVAVDANGIMVAGRRVNPSGNSDALMMRLALDGQLQWSGAVGGEQDEEGHALVRTPDGHFVMAGYTDSYGPTNPQGQRKRCVHLVKMNTAGDTLWTRVQGDFLTHRTALALDVAPNGDLLVGGVRHHGPGLADALAHRYSSTGAHLWERLYQEGKEERILHLHALPVGFVASGWSFGATGKQVLLLRRDALGN